MTVLRFALAAASAGLLAYFLLPDRFASWRPKQREPRLDLWMIPVLALLVALLSFWIAETADAWPMAVAGLAAYCLAVSYVRWPRFRAPWHIETTVTDLGPMLPPGSSRKALRSVGSAPADPKAVEVGNVVHPVFGPMSRIGR